MCLGVLRMKTPFGTHVSSAEVAECVRWCAMSRDEAIAAYVAEQTVNANERMRRFRLQAVLDATGVGASAADVPGTAADTKIRVGNDGSVIGTLYTKPIRVHIDLRVDTACVLEHEQARAAELLQAGGRTRVYLRDGFAVRRLVRPFATLDEAIAWRDGLLFAAVGRRDRTLLPCPACKAYSTAHRYGAVPACSHVAEAWQTTLQRHTQKAVPLTCDQPVPARTHCHCADTRGALQGRCFNGAGTAGHAPQRQALRVSEKLCVAHLLRVPIMSVCSASQTLAQLPWA